jgi:hypothetical protein
VTTLLIAAAVVAIGIVAVLSLIGGHRSAKSKELRYQLSDAGRKRDRKYPLEIVGESHYQEALKAICGGHTKDGHFYETQAVLRLDNDNSYDPNAVAVLIQDRLVGHLSRENAKRYRSLLKKSPETPSQVAAVVMGGWHRGSKDLGSFGVFLALSLTSPKGSRSRSKKPSHGKA